MKTEMDDTTLNSAIAEESILTSQQNSPSPAPDSIITSRSSSPLHDGSSHTRRALSLPRKRSLSSSYERYSPRRRRSPSPRRWRSPSPRRWRSRSPRGRYYMSNDSDVDEFGRIRRRRSPSSEVEHWQGSHRRGSDQNDFERFKKRRRERSRSFNEEENYYDGERRDWRRKRRIRDRSWEKEIKDEDPFIAAGRYLETEFFSTKIYVGELQNVSETHLRKVFSEYGEVLDVRIIEDKGFGFVTMDTKESTLMAIQNVNGLLLGDHQIKVNRAKIPQRNRIGFGNVPWKDDDGIIAAMESEIAVFASLPSSQHSISNDCSPAEISSNLHMAIPSNFRCDIERRVVSYDDL